jgi:hypothetical protein
MKFSQLAFPRLLFERAPLGNNFSTPTKLSLPLKVFVLGADPLVDVNY